MHKLSLQNHATALPHQRGLQCCGQCLLDTPTNILFLLQIWVEFAPFVRENKEQQFTSRHLHEASTKGVGGCFAGSCNKAFMIPLCERPTQWKHGRLFLSGSLTLTKFP